MDWNTIIAWASEQWAGIASTGALGLIAVKAFVFDKLNLNKSAESYTTLQSAVLSTEKQNTAQLEIIYDEFQKISKKLEEQIKTTQQVVTANAQLIDLNIQTLTVANVPVQAKETFYNVLQQIGITNNQVLESLKTSIDLQKIAQTLQEKTTQIVTEKILSL